MMIRMLDRDTEIIPSAQVLPSVESTTGHSALVTLDRHLLPVDAWSSSATQMYSGKRSPANEQCFSHQASQNPLIFSATRSISPGDHPSSLPGFGHMPPLASYLTRGVSSKRVEDVKMNRIDKSKTGRGRRASRRPFVFKSSPLAEGHGVGRLTSFDSNPYSTSTRSSAATLLSRHISDNRSFTESSSQRGRSPFYISRFSNSPLPSSKLINHEFLDSPISLSSLTSSSGNPPSLSTWARQPQISRLRDSKSTKSLYLQKSTDYQTWEISLPKCSLPKLGTASLA